MRAPFKGDDYFSRQINAATERVHEAFLGAIKPSIVLRHGNAMLGDGTITQADTFDLRNVQDFYERLGNAFEVYHVKNLDVKLKLVHAANNQPYVNAPVVLVFCMNPSRVKMNFPPHIIKKFSVQDATLAAAYAQLAAHALGLTSVWIGMIDEQKVMQALVTDLTPAVILCLGYSQKMLHPKPKRKLTELINEI